MNRADRIRKLRALIADPATFEGERDNARAMLARLEATEPAREERGRAWEPWYEEPWYEGVPWARAYGPGRPVRDRMSDDPPPDPAEAWARGTAVPLWHVSRDGFEVEFKWYDPLSAQSFEEMVRAFRKAAGARDDDETGDSTWT